MKSEVGAVQTCGSGYHFGAKPEVAPGDGEGAVDVGAELLLRGGEDGFLGVGGSGGRGKGELGTGADGGR